LRIWRLRHLQISTTRATPPDLISATRTKTGLTVHCELDRTLYPKGITVSDAEFAAINITRADFHGDWNYTIHPQYLDIAINS
jgi:hypothetical protein